jgi:hypothetical protein
MLTFRFGRGKRMGTERWWYAPCADLSGIPASPGSQQHRAHDGVRSGAEWWPCVGPWPAGASSPWACARSPRSHCRHGGCAESTQIRQLWNKLVDCMLRTLSLISPEYLRECTFFRFPGSREKIGPSGTRFTIKLLYF